MISGAGVALVFFVSGTAGLLFEIVWFHRCGLVFGNSVWATTIVLSSFMAGLALGNALVGRFGHRVTRFLRTYAILEAVVAVTGLAITYVIPEVTGVLVPTARRFADLQWLMNAIRLLVAFALLTAPATAMGMTLPVLVGALCRSGAGFGCALGRLYGWNTLGAVAGVLAAEIVLIPRVGVLRTAWCAALLNLVAAAGALWLSGRAQESGRALEPALGSSWGTAQRTSRLLACAVLTGATLMALEVVWFRFLSMFVLNSTTAISTMLAVVLAAMGSGGLAASAWLRRRPGALAYLPALPFAAGCTAALSYVSFQFLSRGPWTAEWSRILWFAFSLTFATSWLSGVIFTFLGEALKRERPVEARAAGWLTLANTIGAMFGPLIATFVMLPVMGMERAIWVLSGLYSAVGLLASPDTWLGRSTRAARARNVAAVIAATVLVSFPFGLMAERYFVRSAELYTTDGSQVMAIREGPSETILLMQQTWLGKPVYNRLVTNGFSMSGTHMSGLRYMRYFVYWPMLLREAPLRRVLVICYGVGVTAAAVTDVDSVNSIDVVEISRDVVSMSDLIYPPAERPLRDQRMRLHVEDGRQFLQVTDRQFDLITGEPPPPLTPGTVNLYTREYFQLIYDRLASGGVTTYWLPVARRGEYDVMPILRAFCDVFEDCSLWNGTPFDWMLVGTRNANGPVTDSALAKAWSHPVLGPHLREIGFEVPQQVGATFLGDAPYLKALTAKTPALTDDYPRRLVPIAGIPVSADPRNLDALDAFRTLIDPAETRKRFEHSRFVHSLWPEELRNETLPFFDHQNIINRIIWEGANPLRHIEELHALITRTSLRRLALWDLGSNDVIQRVADTGNDGTGMVEYQLGVRALAIRNYGAAARYLAESERRGLRDTTIRPLRAYALSLAGELDAASQLNPEVEPSDPAGSGNSDRLVSGNSGRSELSPSDHTLAAPSSEGRDDRHAHAARHPSTPPRRTRPARRRPPRRRGRSDGPSSGE